MPLCVYIHAFMLYVVNIKKQNIGNDIIDIFLLLFKIIIFDLLPTKQSCMTLGLLYSRICEYSIILE